MFKSCAIFVVVSVLLLKECFSQTVVTTSVGRIEGLQKYIQLAGTQRTVTEFLGIPYGEDTSGSNRFQKPIPKAPFNGTYKALTLSTPCMQVQFRGGIFKMTEDCLALNIFVPRILPSTALEVLPVMIWIHGGAFASGSAKGYNAEVLCSEGDVIVVTIDFRLAEFGFLNVGDARAKGNMGLWDQHLAFKWVKNNIRGFMGDPNNITIFGESSGATSVALQALYAGNKGLFQKVIIESGSAFSFWAIRPPSNINLLFRRAGCENGPKDPVACLQNMSSQDFVKVLSRPEITMSGCCSNAPSIDHEFIVESPYDIVFGNNSISASSRQFFRSLDVMSGVNNGDGAFFVLVVWLLRLRQMDMNNLVVKKSDFDDIIAPWIIPNAIHPSNNNSVEALKGAIAFEYVDWNDPNNNDRLRNNLLKLSSDIGFFVPAITTMEAHAATPLGNSYFYEFTAEPPSRFVPTPNWFKGASHADEIQYLFGSPFLNVSFAEIFHFVPTTRDGSVTAADENLSLGIMKAFTNFAKTGNPNLPQDVTQYFKVTWPEYDAVNQQYLQISFNMSAASIKQHFSARAMEFWTKLIPEIVKSST